MIEVLGGERNARRYKVGTMEREFDSSMKDDVPETYTKKKDGSDQLEGKINTD